LVKNLIVAAVSTALAVAAWVLTLSFPSPAEAYRSPSIYPRVIVATILVLCAILAAGAFFRRRVSAAGAGEPETAAPRSLRLPLLLIAVMVAYHLLLQLVGFSAATFAFLLATFVIFGGKLRPGLVFAAGMTAGQYLVFVYLLNVRAPDPLVKFVSGLF
jgi:hypothetical protein